MNVKSVSKKILFFVLDAIAINVAFFLAYFFRFGKFVIQFYSPDSLHILTVITPVFLITFIGFRYYRNVWYHAGFDEYFSGVAANMFAGFAVLVMEVLIKEMILPIVLLATILSTMITIGIRMAYRIGLRVLIKFSRKSNKHERTMIIGAGEAAVLAIREMLNNKRSDLYPVCAIDDNKSKIGMIISGVPVLGTTSSIIKFAKEKQIDTILIAIPSLNVVRKKQIIDICKKTGCAIKSMPGIYEDITGTGMTNAISVIRNISPDELLGKSEIVIDKVKIAECCKGKTILITGAAGTTGSNIARLIAEHAPTKLVLVDINENKLSDLHNEIKAKYQQTDIESIVATVKDKRGIDSIVNSKRPQVVFHCAFQNKDIFVKVSPSEVIKNNIFGTLNVADASNKYKVLKFIMISSDKAANPTHLMSASIRISEMIVQSMDAKSETAFSSIRFGSTKENAQYYIEKFRKDIENGGPVILEHKELSRYSMMPMETANLIMEAASISKGGEIFAIDMGKPVMIYDLAKDMIRLAGYEPETDIQIQVTCNIHDSDIRQDAFAPEGANQTEHERIFTDRSKFDNYIELKEKLDELKVVLENGSDELITYQVVQTVRELVPNFHYLSYEEAVPEGYELDLQEHTEGKRSKRIFLASPHMGGLETMYVNEAFDTNWIAPLGPNVDEFENETARFVDIKAGVAMTTGTAAIHMALRMLNVGKDDLVFCSSLTFAGSCNPIIYESAIPVFIDSETDSWNMSPIALQKAFDECRRAGRMPKAVIVVNLYGQSADYDAIKSICIKYNVPIIEDAAESLGATYKKRFTGTFGKYGVFSFNGNKIITTSGGGMLISDDEIALKKVKFSITQARDQARHYQHSELGFNYRMSNVLAGIGRGQLKVLKMRISQKKEIFEFYTKAFIDIPDIEMMPIAEFGEPNYWLSVITIKETSIVKPLDIILALEKELIESRPVWKPMHLQPFFMKYDFYSHNDEGISVSEDIFNRGICLPSDTKMNEYEMNEVARVVRDCWTE